MLSTLSRQVRPRFARGISQVLAEPTAWNQAPTKVTVLPSGLRVATKESYGEVASVGVFIDAGVRNETAGNAGSAFMVEQLALSGTKKRPKAALESEVEGMGATLAVHAGREQTSYVMSVLKSDIKKGVDILSDLVCNPGIDNFDKEKDGILRSLEELDKPTRGVIEDRLHQCAFRDCSLGFSTIGPFDGADALTKSHLQSYVSSNFTADRTVLVGTGAVEHEELVRLASSLGSLTTGAAPVLEEKPYFCGAELIYRNDEMGPTAYISVGFEGVPWKSADAVTFMVMKHVIGSFKKGEGLVPGTISGNRTINGTANKMGIGCADEFQAFSLNYKDTGVFGFYTACDEVAVEHSIGELMLGINLLSHSVTDEEVARAKRELKVAMFSSSGATDESCAEVGKQVLAYGRGIPEAEMILRIDAVDAEEVKRVAWHYLADAEVSITALGPLHGIPQYFDLRRMTGMHRY